MYLTVKSLFEIVLVSTPLDMGIALVMTIGSQKNHFQAFGALWRGILITNKAFFIHSRPKDEMKQIGDALTSMKT